MKLLPPHTLAGLLNTKAVVRELKSFCAIFVWKPLKRPTNRAGGQMTFEVAVLNRAGVAIAADSAVTTGFPGREKIFATANKIFTLSKVEPVGVMINGHVEHFGCPWEIIVKEFRSKLKARSFPTLRNYVDQFLAFASSARFLNASGQQVTVVVATMSAFAELNRRLDYANSRRNRSTIHQTLTEMLEHANQRAPIRSLDFVTDRKFHRTYGEVVDEVIETDDLVEGNVPQGCRSLFKKVVCASLTHQMPTRFNTGLIFTGFGADELFPKLYEVNVDGGVFGTVRSFDVKEHDVEKEGSIVTAFAQDDAVTAFMNGVDDQYRLFSNGMALHFLDRIVEEILVNHTQYTASEKMVVRRLVEGQIRNAYSDYLKELSDFSESEFTNKITEVLRAAPKETLVELAESLVSITSLRQRVTGALETVGGPVDVAVISKGDGFIWIKRKHYFTLEKNPHFNRNYFREVDNDRT
jgi:hypothetical protein